MRRGDRPQAIDYSCGHAKVSTIVCIYIWRCSSTPPCGEAQAVEKCEKRRKNGVSEQIVASTKTRANKKTSESTTSTNAPPHRTSHRWRHSARAPLRGTRPTRYTSGAPPFASDSEFFLSPSTATARSASPSTHRNDWS
jgi:hypothetical protein